MLQPHIQLDESLGIRCALLPGDPARVDRIASHLQEVQELAYNREFRSLRGTYRGVPVLALSTGIGGASAAIAVEELRHIGVTAMIRIGSCGALQKEIDLGDLIFACGAIRDDGASRAYADLRYPAVPDDGLLRCCQAAAAEQGWPFHTGLVRSHDSFYIDDQEEVSNRWSALGVLGADMETAALFTVGRLRGVRTASILNNVVLWGRDTAGSIGDYAGGEDRTALGEAREILVALEALYRMEEETR
ncbi:nucleoside phosphorylase [Oscillibacter hominis]|uniref:Uridine phosphorylase n=1 Tax=Oscillibacter hominis TaxID=2763056 RepID=A0A7G9B4B5_9FIRM|nr:nucleoside phosphorylase [Oscillibacter hominis]QNL44396.1 nucleoside phosphorylase [Oscillibacter hominis]